MACLQNKVIDKETDKSSSDDSSHSSKEEPIALSLKKVSSIKKEQSVNSPTIEAVENK